VPHVVLIVIITKCGLFICTIIFVLLQFNSCFIQCTALYRTKEIMQCIESSIDDPGGANELHRYAGVAVGRGKGVNELRAMET